MSTQAGYHLTFSTEGNAVGKVVRWLGDVGRLIEVGTPIGITRRNIAKNKIIQFYYCVFQYHRILKTERYVGVQVVLLLTLPTSHQRVGSEVVLKYDVRDNVSSSIVFRSSKWNGASGNPLLEFIYKPKLNLLLVQTINK